MSEHREGLIDPLWDVESEIARIRAEVRAGVQTSNNLAIVIARARERLGLDADLDGSMHDEVLEAIDRLTARVAELEEALFDVWVNSPGYRDPKSERLAQEIEESRDPETQL